MMHPFDIEEEFSRQFSRWATPDNAELFAKRAKCLLDAIHGHVPLCVLFCLIATWCNGWCTSRRFQALGDCRLSNACGGYDGLEHYAVCPAQMQVQRQKLGIIVGSPTLMHFFGLQTDDLDCIVFSACHIYAVKRAIDIQRAKNQTVSDDGNVVASLIWDGHRTAALYHTGLAKRYTHRGQSTFSR